MRGGGYPCPDFLAPFFCKGTVLKMAIFYSNFTVIVCFFSHFCHNHHQNYQHSHHNYHCNHHYHHRYFFLSYVQNVVLTSGKKGPSCPNWGGGLGDSGNARKKTFLFFWCLPLLSMGNSVTATSTSSSWGQNSQKSVSVHIVVSPPNIWDNRDFQIPQPPCYKESRWTAVKTQDFVTTLKYKDHDFSDQSVVTL